MIKFFEIPKNAHTSLFFMEQYFSVSGDIEILALRDPLKRFWSACKTCTPELSPFGNFPSWSPEDHKNAPTTYEGLDLTPQQVINNIKSKLQQNDLNVYLQTQVSYIGDNKFDHVIKVETLRDDINALIKLYNQPEVKDEVWHQVNVSVKEWDDAALEIINADDYIKDFYKDDINLYTSDDYSSLLKT